MRTYAQYPLTRVDHLCSPYTRATYRYTPLLALLLTPNEWLHPSFGKYLFAACDILAGVLMYRLLVRAILPATQARSPPASDSKEDAAKSTSEGVDASAQDTEKLATLLVATHLLNPLVFTISTRGSSESVLALFVLLTLYAAYTARWTAAAVLLGLATHWKIYPFIYGVACLGVIGGEQGVKSGVWGYVRRIVNWRTVWFGFASVGTFALLGVGMYAM